MSGVVTPAMMSYGSWVSTSLGSPNCEWCDDSYKDVIRYQGIYATAAIKCPLLDFSHLRYQSADVGKW